MWLLHSVVVPIIVIGLLVFIHEFGHFLIAKLCGVGVLRFSIGFGPAIFTFRRKETQYQLSIIPLGGYVRMVGDMPDVITGPQPTDDSVRIEAKNGGISDSALDAMRIEVGAGSDPAYAAAVERVIADKSKWFLEKNFWKKSAIVVAGPLFNFIFAIVLVFAAVLIYGARQHEEAARIGNVQEGSPAEAAGLKNGDLVQSIEGLAVSDWDSMAEVVYSSGGKPLAFVVKRGEERVELSLHPKPKKIYSVTGKEKEVYLVGIEPNIVRISGGPFFALERACYWTVNNTMLTYLGVWGMISGQASPKDLAGPLFIFKKAGEEAKQGFDQVIYFTAFLSVTLAVLNLLPIPILDGGHLLFFILEAFLGPISVRKKEYAQGFGMLLLISLMLFAVHNDLTRNEKDLERAGEIKWQEEGSGKQNESGDVKAPDSSTGAMSSSLPSGPSGPSDSASPQAQLPDEH